MENLIELKKKNIYLPIFIIVAVAALAYYFFVYFPENRKINEVHEYKKAVY